jgi:hypothetical protein
VNNSDLARDYQSILPDQLFETKPDRSTSPSFSRNYDRVRSGQYPSMPTSIQATVSTVPTSTYDRISSIATPPKHLTDRHGHQREQVISEEYLVEVEKQSTPKFVSKQHDETSEDDPYLVTGNQFYHGSTSPVDDTRRRSLTNRSSDWRSKLKQAYAPATSDDDRYDQVC